MKEKILKLFKEIDKTHSIFGKHTPNGDIEFLADEVEGLYNADESNNFKKTLKCKDGSMWRLTDEEIKRWENDGSIKSGDILYKVVTDTLY